MLRLLLHKTGRKLTLYEELEGLQFTAPYAIRVAFEWWNRPSSGCWITISSNIRSHCRFLFLSLSIYQHTEHHVCHLPHQNGFVHWMIFIRKYVSVIETNINIINNISPSSISVYKYVCVCVWMFRRVRVGWRISLQENVCSDEAAGRCTLTFVWYHAIANHALTPTLAIINENDVCGDFRCYCNIHTGTRSHGHFSPP